MTSLNTLRVPPLSPILQGRFYRAVAETLFDMPAGLQIDQQQHFLNTRKQNAITLAQLERFIEATLRDPELKRRCEEGGNAPREPYASAVASRYFPCISDFIKVVRMLSERYEFNEHLQVFRDCCAELGLLEFRAWDDLLRDYSQGLLNRAPQVVYFELARLIREKCLSIPTLTAISQRRHEANERFNDYRGCIDASFEKYSRLVFIRLDLYYKNPSLADEDTAKRANADLSRMLNNRRHNELFKGWGGYVAKLEFDLYEGVHWHLLIWLDGRVRDGASHIYLAEQFGRYWSALTKGEGTYWNANANTKGHGLQRGHQGIGLIRDSDAMLRENLTEVLFYLTMSSQLLRPKFGKAFKIIRRGQYPRTCTEKRPGSPRSLSSEQNLADDASDQQNQCPDH